MSHQVFREFEAYNDSYDLNDVPYAVLDQDRSAASCKLLARLDGTDAFHRVASLDRASDVNAVINQQRMLAVVTPFRPGDIMAGKAKPFMLVGAVQATTILLVGQLWFRIPFAGWRRR